MTRSWTALARGAARVAARLGPAAAASALVLLGCTPIAGAGPAPPQWPQWNDGSRCPGSPDVETAWRDPDLAVLRESLCVTAEAPFLYLLFGARDALLIDSGDGAPGLAATVQQLLREHELRSGRRTARLVVAHTHAHADHVRGDTALARHGATVVGRDPRAVASFFGIARWPETTGSVELGSRLVRVVPTPGHEPAHVAFYDRRTGYLFTGDTLYPGRIYVPRADFEVFRESVSRLVAFSRTHRPRAVLGAHVELSRRPGRDYPPGANRHPDERPLPMTPADLEDLGTVAAAAPADPEIVRRPTFILTPLP